MTSREAWELNRIWRVIDRADRVIAEADRLLREDREAAAARVKQPRRGAAWGGDPGVKGYT
jgi:hypothetical protein